jgi:predicted dehydrogenase
MKRVKRLFSAQRTGEFSSTARDQKRSLDLHSFRELPVPRPLRSPDPPRVIIIGAGSRGTSIAQAIVHATNGYLVAVADPDRTRRRHLGQQYIWGIKGPGEGEEFEGWKEFLEWELTLQARQDDGEDHLPKRIDGVFICTADRTHREIVLGLAPLGLHIMCEKPISTSLEHCLDVYRAVRPVVDNEHVNVLFAVGHVMRYAPFYILLRKLPVEDSVVGEVVAIEHTEHIGWCHFAHSYVRYVW